MNMDPTMYTWRTIAKSCFVKRTSFSNGIILTNNMIMWSNSKMNIKYAILTRSKSIKDYKQVINYKLKF